MKIRVTSLLIAVIIFSANATLAHEGMEHDESMESKGSMMHTKESMKEIPHVATKEELETLSNIGNKICPVSGEAIAEVGDGTGVQIVHKDKIYNLCCSMCAKDFKKNPEKFIQKINEELKDNDDIYEEDDTEEYYQKGSHNNDEHDGEVIDEDDLGDEYIEHEHDHDDHEH